MIRKLVLSLVAVLGISAMSFAQNLQVSGRVSGTDGSPIVGATVLVEGSTTNGTSTDIAGEFTLRAPSNGNLVVSFIGYETKTVAINGQTAINVTLEEDAEMIEDVTVVAFGTKRKQDLVGSVTKVKSQTIENSQASSVSKALEGAVAGLQVVSSSGQPGSDGAIVIRGIGSMSAGQTALIVVDGVPFNGSLSDLNPSDIESSSVSKDAVSNSRYGSRAANGVVMVTTKTGRKEATQIAFKASWGVNSRAYEDYDMVTNPAEFYELSWYGIRNTAWIGGRSLPAANLFASQNLLKELA
ncbi:MAG: TonB-dependent receptor plug domain-containing protein, partial [Alistipes sp.]|nr:TonB-dependent receptor plug domain-containing protein [Alistipes sp.]